MIRGASRMLAALSVLAAPAQAAQSCIPVAGSERIVSVSFAAPDGTKVAGVTVLVDYPEQAITIPGKAVDIPPGTVTDVPEGAVAGSNDLDHAFRETIGKAGELMPGRLFTLHFEDCQGAVPTALQRIPCAVEQASDPQANAINGVTCSATAR